MEESDPRSAMIQVVIEEVEKGLHALDFSHKSRMEVKHKHIIL